jgi:hypothetical protein
MGVIFRQKTKDKGQPWWVFISHNGKRTSRKVGSKKAAKKVAIKIEARLKLGEFEIKPEKKKKTPLFKAYAEGFMETYSTVNHKESILCY